MATSKQAFSLHPKFDRRRRAPWQLGIMSNEGKAGLILILIFNCCINLVLSDTSDLRGGIIFQEDNTQGSIFTNLDHLKLIRKADPTILLKSTEMTRAYVNLHQTMCRLIDNRITPFDRTEKAKTEEKQKTNDSYNFDIVFSPFKHQLINAPEVCLEMGGRLPEIRDKASQEAIRFAAIKAGVKKIAAGIKYDPVNNLHRFISDQRDIRTHAPWEGIEYGGEYVDAQHMARGWNDDHFIKKFAPKYPMLYNHPELKFVLRLGDAGDRGYKTNIMCELPKAPPVQTISRETNVLLQMAHHNCKRDEKGLIASTKLIIAEIEAITNLNLTLKEEVINAEDFFPTIIDHATFDADRKRRDTRYQDGSLQLSTIQDQVLKTEMELQKRARKQKIPLTVQGLLVVYDVFKISRPREVPQTYFVDWANEKIRAQYEIVKSGTKLADVDCRYDFTPIPREDEARIRIFSAPRKLINDWAKGDSGIPDYSNKFEKRYQNFLSLFLSEEDPETQQPRIEKYNKICEAKANFVPEANSTPKVDITTQATTTTTKVATTTRVNTTPKAETTTRISTTPRVTTKQETANETNLPLILRTKRTPIAPLALLGIGLGGAAGANAISSAFTGEAPLSWAGKTLGGLFGIQTSTRQDFQALERVSQTIETLSINQKDLATAFNNMNSQMNRVTQSVTGISKATATIVMEQDLKMMIRHMQTLQQLTLQKYAHILLAASLHKTSPYALSQMELDKLAGDMKIKNGLTLSKDLSQIRTTAYDFEGGIQLVFEVPIIEDANMFNFFRLTPVPTFRDNETFIPDIDTKTIAISKSGSEYLVVEPEEYTRCMTDQYRCRISSPVIPITQSSHCAISTYISQTPTCPMIETKRAPAPFFHITGNRTIFSVPQETTLYVKCSGHVFSPKFQDEVVKISGIGEAAFKSSCRITLPNGAKFSTPAATNSENLDDVKIFELLKIFPDKTGIMIIKPSTPEPSKSVELQEFILPSKEQLTRDAFHPGKAIPYLIRTACIAGFMILIAMLISCCWPNIKNFFGHKWWCCCIQPINKEKQQKKKEANEQTLQKALEELEKMRIGMKENAQKWKSSTASILPRNFMTRSMSNMNTYKGYPQVADNQSMFESDLLCDTFPPPPPPLSPHTQKLVYQNTPKPSNLKRTVSFSKDIQGPSTRK